MTTRITEVMGDDGETLAYQTTRTQANPSIINTFTQTPDKKNSSMMKRKSQNLRIRAGLITSGYNQKDNRKTRPYPLTR
jgi:hypothetical protein